MNYRLIGFIIFCVSLNLVVQLVSPASSPEPSSETDSSVGDECETLEKNLCATCKNALTRMFHEKHKKLPESMI
jgi:hypothetical protein